MTFVDDIHGMAKCGINAVELNSFITTNIEMKKLRFNVGGVNQKSKCMKMHVGTKKEQCCEMKVEETSMETVEEIEFLGDILSSDGKNTKNIKSRVSRGLGIISQIFIILENTAFGSHYFEIALLLRESLLLSSVLFSSEVWYGITEKDLYDLEALDVIFFSRLFNVPKTTPIESFFLETGSLRMRDLIKERRVKYLYSLANQEEE